MTFKPQGKQIVMVWEALANGRSTSVEISVALGIGVKQASARLNELGASGVAERGSRSPRNGKGTHGGGGVIAWRPKR